MSFAHENCAFALFDLLRFLAKPASLQKEILLSSELQTLRDNAGVSKMLISVLLEFGELYSYVVHPDQENNEEGEQLLTEINAFIENMFLINEKEVPASRYTKTVDCLDLPEWNLLRRLAREVLSVYSQQNDTFCGNYTLMFTNL